MCNLFANAPAIFIVAIAGGFALCALIISKLCSFGFRRNFKSPVSSAYECGFEANKLRVFFSEKSYVISVFLLFELLFTWLLSCVPICIMPDIRLDRCIVILPALLLSLFIALGTKHIFHNRPSK